MSPGRITVQGMMPEIFCPGPARFRIAPFKVSIRARTCWSLRADSSVCGSSSTTSDGRTARPSARLNFMPRMRLSIPATRMIAPEALLPAMVGSTISSAVQTMRVALPPQSCPLARL